MAAPVSDLDVEAALAYARRHVLHAILVQHGGTVLVEHYGEEYGRDVPHALYSGTKSFWGVLAVAAEEDGLLRLDERVADTVPEWQADPRKALVTLRELLTLTSGIGFGGLGTAVPTFEAALAVALKNDPGTTFTYGGIPLQAFGAVLSRKLGGADPVRFLHERVLNRLGVRLFPGCPQVGVVPHWPSRSTARPHCAPSEIKETLWPIHSSTSN